MRSLCLSIAALFVAGSALANTTAIINVNVLPMTSAAVIEGQTVLVEGRRIVAIGDVERTPVPEGATIVDGTDRFLMPGLAEMHAHVPNTGTESLDRSTVPSDRVTTNSVPAVTLFR